MKAKTERTSKGLKESTSININYMTRTQIREGTGRVTNKAGTG
jgi:hypothetical protein